MRDVEYDELLQITSAQETAATRDLPARLDLSTVTPQLKEYFDQDREVERTVLGMDIYRYSRYELPKQRLIPFVFSYLYRRTIAFLRQEQSLFFRDTPEAYRERFIPTGDGGFQILASPLHALAFAIVFETELQVFNGFASLPYVRELLGPLTMRWCVTHDRLYRFEGNYFGTAIINNARILAKDALNRFLVDSSVMDWFYRHVGNVESMALMDTADIHRRLAIPAADSGSDFLFGQGGHFTTIMSQRIGELHSKDRAVEVYSLFLQRKILITDDEDVTRKRGLVVSLGNTNPSGLSG